MTPARFWTFGIGCFLFGFCGRGLLHAGCAEAKPAGLQKPFDPVPEARWDPDTARAILSTTTRFVWWNDEMWIPPKTVTPGQPIEMFYTDENSTNWPLCICEVKQ